MESNKANNSINRMKELISILNEAGKVYYANGREIMSNLEYDRLYDELLKLEESEGTILSGSPTQNVGYEVLSELPKEEHQSKMLSLDKTKDRDSLPGWLGDKEALLSWKLDGLTVVLTYENGELIKAVTRGNGEIGEVITQNARNFVNLPVKIDYNEELIIRGEAVISYKDFMEINEKIPELDAKYKNPRNLCSGSVRQLDSSITKERKVGFYAFSVVSDSRYGRRSEELDWLNTLGFDTVNYRLVNSENVVSVVEDFEDEIADNPIPSDGLVLTLDDIEYSKSLGTTAKFPRDSIAFKWKDELAETVLREIEWSASRTGLINPVAIFDPVELEGTTVSRASMHNISIMEELKIGLGDRITVYKANMIIPQVADNLTKSGNLKIPEICPVCGEGTHINNDNGVKTLICLNPNCTAKKIKSFTHFVSRNAMDVEGLSEMTIEKFIAKGIIKEYSDIFRLDRFKDEIVNMEGFGEKSYVNLMESADKSRHVTPDRLLYALGVPGIGTANARVITQHCENKWNEIENLRVDELMSIEGVGDVLAQGFRDFFNDGENKRLVTDLLDILELDESYEDNSDNQFLKGITFVITGTLNKYPNRDELVATIERAGGKVSSSVSSKTSYLINNDITSSSGKNKKAKELGVPIIDEDTVDNWLKSGEISL